MRSTLSKAESKAVAAMSTAANATADTFMLAVSPSACTPPSCRGTNASLHKATLAAVSHKLLLHNLTHVCMHPSQLQRHNASLHKADNGCSVSKTASSRCHTRQCHVLHKHRTCDMVSMHQALSSAADLHWRLLLNSPCIAPRSGFCCTICPYSKSLTTSVEVQYAQIP